MTRVDSPVLLMHHGPDRSWINDPDPDHPKGTQPMCNWGAEHRWVLEARRGIEGFETSGKILFI